MRKISEIIIHCAATPEGKHFTVADIDAWHKKRGFRCIGYHFVIYLDGSVHEARARVDILRHGHRLQRAVPRHAILLDVSPRRQPRSARPRPASQEQGKHRGAYHRKYAAHHYRQAARGSLDHTHLHGLGRAYGV